ncbi:MAG TPA: hypothetical protein VII03_01060, partial [Solirubrobacteraceae bacterium]
MASRLVHHPSLDATLVGWLWGQASITLMTAYSVVLQFESCVDAPSEKLPLGSHLNATHMPPSCSMKATAGWCNCP